MTGKESFYNVGGRKKKPKTEDADPEKKGADNGENEDEVPVVYDEAKCLPKERCLQALADLRHTRWFCSMALNLPSCVECIRLVKDLAKRDPKWSVLKDWTVELLVERALYSAQVPLNPAASIMRVMEVRSGSYIDVQERNTFLAIFSLSCCSQNFIFFIIYECPSKLVCSTGRYF